MFRVAQYIVRHKVGATAVLALGVFFLMPNKNEQAEQQSSSPWAAQSAPSQTVQAEEAGFVDKMVDGAVAYLDENDINPLDQADEAVGRFDDTASAYGNVNQRNAR